MLSTLRLVLSVDVEPGVQHNAKHATDGLWSLLDRWDQPLAEAAAGRTRLGHRARHGQGRETQPGLFVPLADDEE